MHGPIAEICAGRASHTLVETAEAAFALRELRCLLTQCSPAAQTALHTLAPAVELVDHINALLVETPGAPEAAVLMVAYLFDLRFQVERAMLRTSLV